MFRISSMIGSLKCPYPGLSTDTTSDILTQIQTSIRQKVDIWSRDKPPMPQPSLQQRLVISKSFLLYLMSQFYFLANPIKFASA